MVEDGCDTTGDDISQDRHIVGDQTLFSLPRGSLVSALLPSDMSQELIEWAQKNVIATFILWDLLIPNITWIILSLFWVLPNHLRAIPFLIWLIPYFVSTTGVMSSIPLLQQSMTKVQLCLQRVARDKALNISGSPEAENALCSSRPCIMPLYPHGRYPMDIFPLVNSQSHAQFKNLVIAQSSLGKFVPSVGLTTMFCPVIDVTRKSILEALVQGKDVALFPGGAKEMVLCYPFDDRISLVKRRGFLHLVYSTSTTIDSGRSVPLVIPTFIFGMNDAFFNPLSWFDEMLHDKIGINLPLWLPTTLFTCGVKASTLVQGDPLDARNYDSEEAFYVAFYNSVEKLFETHKHDYPMYKGRHIQWIETETRMKQRKDTPTQRIDSYQKVQQFHWKFGISSLIGPSIVARLVTGTWWRMSTFESYEARSLDQDFSQHLNPVLHVTSCCSWLLFSYLTASRLVRHYVRFHRYLGYFGILSLMIMCGTASHLVITPLYDELRADVEEYAALRRIANKIISAVSNLFVGSMLMIFTGVALAAVKEGNKDLHMSCMMLIQMNLIMSFGPRFYAMFLRPIFPYFSTETILSLSIGVQWYVYKKKVWDGRSGERIMIMKSVTIPSFKCIGTALIIGIWGGKMAVTVISPLIPLCYGIVLYHQNHKEKKKVI